MFGMLDEDHYADPDGPDPKQKKREKRPPREEPADAFEYTSREQNAEIGSMLKKAVKQSRLRLAGVLFFALATLYLALRRPTPRSIRISCGRGATASFISLSICRCCCSSRR